MCSTICEKSTKREEMEASSNSPILAVIIFSRLTGRNESQKLVGQDIFVKCSRLRTMVAYMEARWSGGEVGSGGGDICHWIVLIRSCGDTRSYKIVSPPNPRGRRTLLVTLAEAKKGGWVEKCEGSKTKIEDK